MEWLNRAAVKKSREQTVSDGGGLLNTRVAVVARIVARGSTDRVQRMPSALEIRPCPAMTLFMRPSRLSTIHVRFTGLWNLGTIRNTRPRLVHGDLSLPLMRRG